MRIKSVFFALLIAITISMPVTAGERPTSKQLSEHVYVYVGSADSSSIAKEMLSNLPQQGRNKIPFMVEVNLKMRYLQSNTDKN